MIPHHLEGIIVAEVNPLYQIYFAPSEFLE